MSTVRAFGPTEVVQGVTRRLPLFEVSQTVLGVSIPARSDSAGGIEEGDEERFCGWETRG
jgi:hypothetical protein